jgi:hypothetical protein
MRDTSVTIALDCGGSFGDTPPFFIGFRLVVNLSPTQGCDYRINDTLKQTDKGGELRLCQTVNQLVSVLEVAHR